MCPAGLGLRVTDWSVSDYILTSGWPQSRTGHECVTLVALYATRGLTVRMQIADTLQPALLGPRTNIDSRRAS